LINVDTVFIGKLGNV